MIDITTYRQRIGGFSPSCKRYAKMDKSHRVSLKLNRNKFCSGGFYIRGGLRLSPNGFVTWCETIEFSTGDNVGLKLGQLFYIRLFSLGACLMEIFFFGSKKCFFPICIKNLSAPNPLILLSYN